MAKSSARAAAIAARIQLSDSRPSQGHDGACAASPVYLTASWLGARGLNASALVTMQVNTIAMYPAVQPADLLVVNVMDREPEQGRCYFIDNGGLLEIRRARRRGAAWWLCSDHDDKTQFPDRPLGGLPGCILGRVVLLQREQI